MDPVAVSLIVAGGGGLGVSFSGARGPIPPLEQRGFPALDGPPGGVFPPLLVPMPPGHPPLGNGGGVFHAVNGLPEWLYRPLWVPMQLGNLLVGTGVGLFIALLFRSWAMAASVVVAMLLKLLAERVVRARLRSLVQIRQRPGTSQTG